MYQEELPRFSFSYRVCRYGDYHLPLYNHDKVLPNFQKHKWVVGAHPYNYNILFLSFVLVHLLYYSKEGLLPSYIGCYFFLFLLYLLLPIYKLLNLFLASIFVGLLNIYLWFPNRVLLNTKEQVYLNFPLEFRNILYLFF